MISFTTFIIENFAAISLVGQLILVILVLYLSTKFARKSAEKDIEKHNVRITRIELKLENIPTKDDLHQLENNMIELNGELKRVDENLDGAEGLIKRLEKQVNRMDTFWRSK